MKINFALQQIANFTGNGGQRSAEAILQITELISGRMTLLLTQGQNETLILSPLEDSTLYLFHQKFEVNVNAENKRSLQKWIKMPYTKIRLNSNFRAKFTLHYSPFFLILKIQCPKIQFFHLIFFI
jgi:hypothetical protein